LWSNPSVRSMVKDLRQEVWNECSYSHCYNIHTLYQ
jgi:hypothetical protein